MPETVERAAIRVNGVLWDFPRPARYHILVHAWCYAHYVNGKPARIPEHEQGFITSEGRFVDRSEAAVLAYQAGQILLEKKSLFSEDLW